MDPDTAEDVLKRVQDDWDAVTLPELTEAACLTGENVGNRAMNWLEYYLFVTVPIPERELEQCAARLADGATRNQYLPLVAQALAVHPDSPPAVRDAGLTLLADYITGEWFRQARSWAGWLETALEISQVLLAKEPTEPAQIVSDFRTCPGEVSEVAWGRLLVAVASA